MLLTVINENLKILIKRKGNFVMSKMNRHQHRIVALQVLYGLDLRGRMAEDEVILELKRLAKNEDAPKLDQDDDYYFQLIRGVILTRGELDGIIQELSIDWEIERLSSLVRNILRLALWELENEVPEGVVINEAVELAKEFDGQKAASFINGVLGRKVRGGRD